jgi:glycosyltransferase involved in cell wall biosynthesis
LLSIVVPTYRGSESLETLLSRLRAVLVDRGQPYEVIIINDASPDDTWPVLVRLSTEHPELCAIDLLANHGQPIATTCGLDRARGSLVATMDDDLQHPPEELPKLLDAREAHPEWDAVVGCWPRDEGAFRDLGSTIYELADRIAHDTPKGYRHSAFRVMRRPVVDALVNHRTRNPIVGPLLKQAASRVENITVEHHERPHGHSGFRIGVGMHRVFSNFLHGSALPLRLLSRLGLASAGFALLLTLYYLLAWTLGASPPVGWRSTFLAIVFFGGAALFGIGVLGEYTHLLIREVRQPPRWSIRGEIGGEGPG